MLRMQLRGGRGRARKGTVHCHHRCRQHTKGIASTAETHSEQQGGRLLQREHHGKEHDDGDGEEADELVDEVAACVV